MSFWSRPNSAVSCSRNEVIVYSDANFKGTKFVLTGPLDYNDTDTEVDYTLTDFDDTISSLEVGWRVRAIFCLDSDCLEKAEIVGPYKASTLGEWDNKISYIKLMRYSQFKKPMVQIFGNSGFDLDGKAAVFGPGDYQEQDLLDSGLDQESATSLSIPSGLHVRLYQEDNFQGESLDLSGPLEYDLSNSPSHFSWNDKTRSLEVIWARVEINKLVGHWGEIATGYGPIEMKIHKHYSFVDNSTSDFNVTLTSDY